MTTPELRAITECFTPPPVASTSVGSDIGRNEKSTDQFVRDMLRDIGFERPHEQGSGPQYLRDALAKNASKARSGKGPGKPEFLVVSGDFLVVIEDKKDISRAQRLVDGQIDNTFPARNDFALNGAVHYATVLADRTGKRVFAIGVAGSERHHEILIAIVEPGGGAPTVLGTIDALTDLAPDNIDEYYRVAVKGELPREAREVREIRKVAADLHEDMRNHASLEGERKATLVSAILLALKGNPRLLDAMHGISVDDSPMLSDGSLVYQSAEAYLRRSGLRPEQKIGALLDQFSFIRTHVLLNGVNSDLGDITPMRRFVEVLDQDVLQAVADPTRTAFDVLGNFYGEFVKYGGSDGNALGIVLTPHHITDLMAELIDVDSDDIVLDPCSGTAGFLIAAMRRMFNDADARYKRDGAALTDVREEIRADRLHGIELQDKLFAIGTTNMILRGDGKANFQRHNFFDLDIAELRGEHGFTKILINPPYSQSKNKQTRHLSELSFIDRALSALDHKGQLAAIVPQSAMVGKTKEDKALKAKILSQHTLDAVITMNPDTFYGVGTHVVVALFTAGVPHTAWKKATFIDFSDDGYKVRPHLGLMGDGNEKSRRAHLLSVLRDGAPDDTSFVVRTEVTAEDEWQHSYFYFNDSPPTLEDFQSVVADYLTWRVDMFTHGKAHLIQTSSEVTT